MFPTPFSSPQKTEIVDLVISWGWWKYSGKLNTSPGNQSCFVLNVMIDNFEDIQSGIEGRM